MDIPARYVEGYTVSAKAGEATNVDAKSAGAWVEVYQDGAGWLPLALTPGLEDLSAEQTESGVKPVGAGKEGTGDGPRVTEGQELEQNDAEPDNSEDNTPEGGERTGLLKKPLFWVILIAGLLLLLIAIIVIRHAIILKKRNETFHLPDNSEASANLFADTAKLLGALGFERGTGSMLELCEGVENRFGAENADKLRKMTLLNARALFSTKALTNDERTDMENYRFNVLDLLKTNTKWPKKLRLKWLSCLY